MPDRDKPNERGLFGGVFARGPVAADDTAWLQAMLDAEAGLARALERAGLAPAGSGEAVTAAAKAADFQADELGGLAALTGNPVPGLARALARRGTRPGAARAALAHRPAADHRPGRRARPGHGGARQDRQGRHAARPDRDRRGPRGRGAAKRALASAGLASAGLTGTGLTGTGLAGGEPAPRRFVGDAAQAQPGRGDRPPGLAAGGARAARHAGRLARAGRPGGGRRR